MAAKEPKMATKEPKNGRQGTQKWLPRNQKMAAKEPKNGFP